MNYLIDTQILIWYQLKETLNKLISFMVRQAHHERNQLLTVRPEHVEGLNQSFLNSNRLHARNVDLLTDRKNNIFVSQISLFEIAIKKKLANCPNWICRSAILPTLSKATILI